MDKFHRSFLMMLFAFSVMLMAGCNTEEDTDKPGITVSQPLPGRIYDNGDTIRFQAYFSDNFQLNSIEISLVDDHNKPLLSTLSLVPDHNPYTLEGEYIIDDPLLPGGIYQLRFRASDGVNITNYFVEIQIHELSRQLLYPLIVTHPEAGKWKAYRLTSTNSWHEISVHSGDYCGSAVNSAASQLYMCGIAQSDLAAIKLPNGEPLWNVKPKFHQSQRWFEAITFNYPDLYTCTAEGNIRAYDKTGNEIYKSATFSNATPHLSVLTKNLVISTFKDAFSNDRFLVAFHNSGGALIYNKFIQADVACLLNISGDKALVLANNSGQGEISLYNGSDNTLAPLHPFYEGTFYRASMMDSENYLISTSRGLYCYQMSKNSLTPFVSKMSNGNIYCDNTSQLVYTTYGKTMEVYAFPDALLVESYPLPDTAIDIHLVYNK